MSFISALGKCPFIYTYSMEAGVIPKVKVNGFDKECVLLLSGAAPKAFVLCVDTS